MLRERFQRLFRGSEGWYGQYEADPETGAKLNAHTSAGPIPDEVWDRHLAGEGYGLGIVPITEEGTCYWGCVDLDDDNTDHKKLVTKINALGLPFVVCRSKSGGAHLFLFFIEPIKPIHLIAKLTRWARELQLKNPVDEQGRSRPVEIFPKQTSLSAGQAGNWLNLPYFGGDETTRYGFDDDGNPLSLEAFLELAYSKRLTEDQLDVRKAKLDASSDVYFSDGPPCLQALHEQGLPKGTRNDGLYNVGIYLKLKFPDTWEEQLRDYNKTSGRVDPPLPDDEVDTIIKSLSRRDYIYKCSDAPIVGFCKRGPCKKQEYGIDRFRQDKDLEAFPKMGRLVSFENGIDEPLYELEIGGKRLLLSPDELTMMGQFKRCAFRQARLVVPQLKQRTWDDKIRDLVEDVLVVEIPNDAGVVGRILARFKEFLLQRHKSDSEQDILDDRPYAQNGKVYFRSQGLLKYLEQGPARLNLQGVNVWSVLKNEGAGFTTLKIKGADVEVWWFPVPEDDQTEDFDTRGHDDPSF